MQKEDCNNHNLQDNHQKKEQEKHNQYSQIIQIDEKWIHPDSKSKIINFDILVCPVCYGIPIKKKFQCFQCGRIFCEDDYQAVKSKGSQCPICKLKPWKVKDELHILYKSIYQNICFRCDICDDNQKSYRCQELLKHISLEHDKKIQNFQQLRDFDVVFSKDDILRLNFYQNLEVNYENIIRKSKDIEIQLEDGYKLNMNIAKGTALHSNKGMAKIRYEPSKVLQAKKPYYLWQIKLDNGFKHYKSNFQDDLQHYYALYNKNNRLNQFNFDLSDNRYRVSFKYMTQINTASEFQRVIRRKQIQFFK